MSVIGKTVVLKADHSRVGIVKGIDKVTKDLIVEGWSSLVSISDVIVKVEKEYCLGFYFNENCTKVALINKLRPDYQANKLNGIGGKLEDNEPPMLAMIREFKEEAGIIVSNWVDSGVLSDGKTYAVHIFASKGDLSKVKTMTDEIVGIYAVKDLPNLKCVYGLPMFIKEAINKLLKIG